jgi:hypothetical protein
MTSIKKLKKFIKNAPIKSDAVMNQKILSELLEEIPDKPYIRSIIMKNLSLKLGIAAIIIIAFVFIFVMVTPNHDNGELKPVPVEIPQELASMSVEELLALHYHPEKSSYDPNLIRAALTQALDKMDSKQVLAAAKVFAGLDRPQGARGGGRGGMRAPTDEVGGTISGSAYPVTADISKYNWMPLYNFLVNKQRYDHVVEETPNLYVNCRLLKVTINVDDIIQALVKKWEIRTEWMDEKYRATVQLEVIDTSPKNAIKKGRIITVPTLIVKGQLESLKIGSQYYIGMLQTKSGIGFLPYLRGIFEIKPTAETDMSATRFWVFLCDTQDILLFSNKPKENVIDYWKSVLSTENYEMALTFMNIMPKELMPGEIVRDTIVERLLNENTYEKAFDYLAMLPDEFIPAQAIVDVIEQKYQSLAVQLQQNNAVGMSGQPAGYNPRTSILNIEKTASLLFRSGDKDSIKRMVALLEQDRNYSNEGGIFWTSVSYLRQTNRPFTIQLLIALEKDNPGNLFVNIYKKYKDNPLITKVYESSSDFANELMSIILGQVEKPVDEETYSMVVDTLENLSTYQINTTETIKKMWTILNSGENFDIRSYLEEFFKNPDLSNIGVVRNSNNPSYADPQFDFERTALEILMQLPEDKRPTHKEQLDMLLMILKRHRDNNSCIYFVANTLGYIVKKGDIDAIPVLSELLLNEKVLHWDVPNIITSCIPDPAFIPVLKQALKIKFNPDLLKLLVVCGDKEGALSIARQQKETNGVTLNALFSAGHEDTAIQLALERLKTPIRSDNRNNTMQDIRQLPEIISLLGKSGRKELIAIIEPYTDAEFVNNFTRGTPGISGGRELQETAIMALARIGGKEAIDRLRYIYETNEDIYMRHIAALSLYYLGDDTGWSIIEPLINNTYIEHSEVAIQLERNFSMSSILQHPITRGLLGSERTEALLIEKMRNYLDLDQYALFVDPGNKNETTKFFEKYKSEIMPILIDQLSSPSAVTRAASIDFLRKITGKDFGFQPKIQYSQKQIIQQWKDYIKREY